MRIVLLDDSRAHNAQMRQAIENICGDAHIPAEIALEATCFDEVAAYVAGNPPLTVYFFDIQLEEEKTGVDVCRALRRENVRDRFIFVSAYPHYALDCLNVHAYDLLLKPVDLNALRQCLISVYRDIQADAPQMLDIQIGSRLIRMPVRDVYYFESQGRNVIAHTSRGDFSYAAALSGLKETLAADGFVQIHRKYLVNRAHIQEWDTGADTVLVHGTPLPLARRMRRELISED